MKLLFDANFSPRIVRALSELELEPELIHSTQHLPANATDPEVFELARKLEAILVTKDRKILKRQHELAAFRSAGIGAFIFTGTAERRLAEEAGFVLAMIEEIVKVAGRNRPPYVHRVTDHRKIEKLL